MIRCTSDHRSKPYPSSTDWIILLFLVFFLCIGVVATVGGATVGGATARVAPTLAVASFPMGATLAIAPTATWTLAPIPTISPQPNSPPPIMLLPSHTPQPLLSHFMASELITSANCQYTMVHGTIHDGLTTLNGVRVRVWWTNAPPDRLFSNPSGTIPELGSGRYQVLLNDTPKAGSWLAAVVDDGGSPLSDVVEFETTARGCEDGSGQQVIQLDFWRSEGTLGVGGATLTPLPAAVSTLPPTPVVVVPAPIAPDGVERTLKVPILMFHYISVPPEESDIYRHDLSVGEDIFRADLITLREQGYSSITLSQLSYAIQQGTPLPEKPIVLTFDDGYLDNYTNAFPIMKEEGFVGTFFVITDLIEQRHPAYMTWEQLLEMQGAGMEIGSHTKSHAELPGMAYEAVWEELAGSRVMLEHRLGREIHAFCYPFGKFDPGVSHLAKEAGYWIAVSTKQGVTHTNNNILTLHRVRVRGGQFPPQLMNLINYWMYEAQEE